MALACSHRPRVSTFLVLCCTVAIGAAGAGGSAGRSLLRSGLGLQAHAEVHTPSQRPLLNHIVNCCDLRLAYALRPRGWLGPTPVPARSPTNELKPCTAPRAHPQTPTAAASCDCNALTPEDFAGPSVCGVDGITYASACLARCQSVKTRPNPGPCRPADEDSFASPKETAALGASRAVGVRRVGRYLNARCSRRLPFRPAADGGQPMAACDLAPDFLAAAAG
jgi:hypothetical protein